MHKTIALSFSVKSRVLAFESSKLCRSSTPALHITEWARRSVDRTSTSFRNQTELITRLEILILSLIWFVWRKFELEVASIQMNEDDVVDWKRSNSTYLNPLLCRFKYVELFLSPDKDNGTAKAVKVFKTLNALTM